MRTALVCLAVAVSLALALPAGAGLVGDEEPSVSSGEALSGGLAVHGENLDGELEARAFERALARADTAEKRAALLSERRLRVEARAANLSQRRERLRAERNSGALTETAYRVQAARTTAEARQLRERLETIASRSRPLPAGVRAAYGLDDEALNRSLARVDSATAADAETAFEAAVDERSASTDGSTEARRSIRRETERAVTETEERREQIASLFDALEGEGVDRELLRCGRHNLSAAADATDRASAALADADASTAESALVDARVRLRSAHRCLDPLEGGAWQRHAWHDSYEWNGTVENRTWDGDSYDWDRDSFEEAYDNQTYDGDRDRDGYDRDRDSYDGRDRQDRKHDREQSTRDRTPTEDDYNRSRRNDASG